MAGASTSCDIWPWWPSLKTNNETRAGLIQKPQERVFYYLPLSIFQTLSLDSENQPPEFQPDVHGASFLTVIYNLKLYVNAGWKYKHVTTCKHSTVGICPSCLWRTLIIHFIVSYLTVMGNVCRQPGWVYDGEKTHPWACLWGSVQRDLAEEGRPTLRVSNIQ